MEKKYKEIEFGFGDIESAVKELQQYRERGQLVVGVFNGVKIYSDVDDLESAYLKIVGKTKAEHDQYLQEQRDKYDKELAEHEAAIPELTKEWITKGEQVLDENYHELWRECVPIRLSDLYRGYELGCAIDIVKKLNEGGTLEEAKEIHASQGHSGMSHRLLCSMVNSFCDRGDEFVEYVNK